MLYEDEAYVNWLKSLKPGDEVAIESVWKNHYEFDRVAKITRTGMIRLESELLVDSSGNLSALRKIKPVTAEIKEKMARFDAIFYIEDFNLISLPTEALLKILEIIKEHEHEESN